MQFTEIHSPKDPVATEILEAYTQSFPEDERRSEEQFCELFTKPDCRVISICAENERIGYMIIWQLEGFAFLEHFEVYSRYRNRKFGAVILSELHTVYPKVILESEPDTESELAARRLKFYERNRFSVILRDYTQPSYGPGKKPVRLFLLADFAVNDPENISQKIHGKVYA